MKLSRLAWMGVAAVVVTGCSSVEKERASGGFEYVNIQPTASLNIRWSGEAGKRNSVSNSGYEHSTSSCWL